MSMQHIRAHNQTDYSNPLLVSQYCTTEMLAANGIIFINTTLTGGMLGGLQLMTKVQNCSV